MKLAIALAVFLFNFVTSSLVDLTIGGGQIYLTYNVLLALSGSLIFWIIASFMDKGSERRK